MPLLQVLGPGCPKCKKLAENAEAAAKALGVGYHLEKITDLKTMMALGVMVTPALVVDGQVKAAGKVPSVEEIQAMLT